MKKIKVTLSIGVLLATMAVVGMSGSQVAFAEEGVGNCNCQITRSGEFGIIRNNDCSVERCIFIIE